MKTSHTKGYSKTMGNIDINNFKYSVIVPCAQILDAWEEGLTEVGIYLDFLNTLNPKVTAIYQELGEAELTVFYNSRKDLKDFLTGWDVQEGGRGSEADIVEQMAEIGL